MRTRLTFAAGAILAAALPLCAVDGTVLATTAEPCSFRLDSTGESPVVVSSQEGLAALMPLGWSKGDDVVALAPDGIAHPIVSSASAAGSASVAQYVDAGGVWLLSNPTYGTVKLGVAWSVFGDGGTLAESAAAPFVADTVLDGPNRRNAMQPIPPITYSGDGWSGDGTAASSLTVAPPAGKGSPTVFAGLAGDGAQPFAFNRSGLWSVTLTMADGTMREALISVIGGFGMVIQ